LAIPAVLGDVVTFSTVEDPSTRVPDMIAFMNDSDIDVTLHFDAGNNKAQVISTVDGSGGYTVGSTTKTLNIAIDGEDPVEFNLTTGSRSQAQVAADINTALAGAGGNTALARAVPYGNGIAIVSGTTGEFSAVTIGTPSGNSANAVIGLTPGTSTNGTSFSPDIVESITIVAKGQGTFVNPRKSAPSLRIRGQVGDGSTGVSAMIDATTLFSYSGVQQ
jgi:hypothetical protein